MNKLICEAIPFRYFKERIRIVKDIERKHKNATIEIYKNFVVIQYKI
ncbi:hypothetical protein [Clostridium perfringens]|nr:hypothetical protein [Clostridium perfringens]VTQ55164.1 Uncharacterised protein [Clostridium perfringens]